MLIILPKTELYLTISEIMSASDLPPLPSIEEPKSYYQGLDVADRPLCRNVIAFERRTRETLQQRQLSNRLHHRYVLMRVINTGGVVSVDGTSIQLEAGDALLVAPYQFHHYIQLTGDALRWVFITFELEKGDSTLADLSGRVLHFDFEMCRIWTQAIACWKNRDECLLPTLDCLLTRLETTDGLGRANHRASGSGAWISKTESLILDSVQTGWTLEEVARRVGLSDRHMRTRFEAQTGVSPKDYRANYQFHLALSMMREPSRSLSEIAERCGFQSSSVFNRFIRRMADVTPSQLRKLVLSGEFVPVV